MIIWRVSNLIKIKTSHHIKYHLFINKIIVYKIKAIAIK